MNTNWMGTASKFMGSVFHTNRHHAVCNLRNISTGYDFGYLPNRKFPRNTIISAFWVVDSLNFKNNTDISTQAHLNFKTEQIFEQNSCFSLP